MKNGRYNSPPLEIDFVLEVIASPSSKQYTRTTSPTADAA